MAVIPPIIITSTLTTIATAEFLRFILSSPDLYQLLFFVDLRLNIDIFFDKSKRNPPKQRYDNC